MVWDFGAKGLGPGLDNSALLALIIIARAWVQRVVVVGKKKHP